MIAAAKKHPDVQVRAGDRHTQSKNMAEYFGAGEDAIYLSGMAAGAATKNGTIGYVVPFAIPEVIRHANAFALGAQATHPGREGEADLDELVVLPAKEKKAAESLNAAGADVLGQNVDSPAAGQYAESVGVPWVGYDSNAKKFAPKSWLTAAVYNWGPYYLKRVKAAMNGSWKTGFYYGSIKDGFIELAPYGPKVSAATKAQIAAKKAGARSAARSTSSRVRSTTRAGKLRVAEGQAADGQGPLRDGLARQGRHRQPEGLADARRRAGRPRSARPAHMPAAVELRGITKRFPGVVANDGVDFEAAEGEVHALLGENGAGKSTLSNILTGLYRPDEGEILLYGEPVSSARRATRSTPGSGWCTSTSGSCRRSPSPRT